MKYTSFFSVCIMPLPLVMLIVSVFFVGCAEKFAEQDIDYYSIGAVHDRRGEYDEAILDYGKAIETGPENADV